MCGLGWAVETFKRTAGCKPRVAAPGARTTMDLAGAPPHLDDIRKMQRAGVSGHDAESARAPPCRFRAIRIDDIVRLLLPSESSAFARPSAPPDPSHAVQVPVGRTSPPDGCNPCMMFRLTTIIASMSPLPSRTA